MRRVAITTLLFAMGCVPGLLEAPTVTLTPAAPTSADDIVAGADCEDCTYRWFQEGTLIPGLTGDTVPANHTVRGDTWRVLVAEADGPPTEAEVTVGNAPPEVIWVELSPDELRTDDLATVNAQAEDADGDLLVLEVHWYVNGELIGSQQDTTLSGAWFQKGDELRADVGATDGEESSLTLSSNTVTVLNSPPTEPGLTIEAIQGVGLQCKISSPAYDADGDDLEHSFSWTLDGDPFTFVDETDHAGDTVPGESGFFSEGQLWGCRVEVTESDVMGASPVVATATYEVFDRQWALDLGATLGFVTVGHTSNMDVGIGDLSIEFVLRQTQQDDGHSALSWRGNANNHVLVEAVHSDAGWSPKLTFKSTMLGKPTWLVCTVDETVAYGRFVHLLFQRKGDDGSGMSMGTSIPLPSFYVDGVKLYVGCTLQVDDGAASSITDGTALAVNSSSPWIIGWGDPATPSSDFGEFGGTLAALRYTANLIVSPTTEEFEPPELPLGDDGHTVVNFLLNEGSGLDLRDEVSGGLAGAVDDEAAWTLMAGTCGDVMALQAPQAHVAFNSDLVEAFSGLVGVMADGFEPTHKPGAPGHGMSLGVSADALGDWVRWSGVELDPDDGLSIGAWVKLQRDQTASIVSAAGAGWWDLGIDASDEGSALYVHKGSGPTGPVTLCASSALWDGGWHHVGMSWNGGAGDGDTVLYVDGEPCGDQITTTAGAATLEDISVNNLYVGVRWGGDDQPFDGHIDDVWVSGTALSRDRMMQLSVCTDD
jgi:hypothetical protein